MRRLFVYDKELKKVVEIERIEVEPKVHIISDNLGQYIENPSIDPRSGMKTHYISKSQYKKAVHATGNRIVGNDYANMTESQKDKYIRKGFDQTKIDVKAAFEQAKRSLLYKND